MATAPRLPQGLVVLRAHSLLGLAATSDTALRNRQLKAVAQKPGAHKPNLASGPPVHTKGQNDIPTIPGKIPSIQIFQRPDDYL
jgi:hypothetical protein